MTFEVGYESDGFCSINLIESADKETAERYAKAHANRFGYNLLYCHSVAEWYKHECLAKGMPIIKL